MWPLHHVVLSRFFFSKKLKLCTDHSTHVIRTGTDIHMLKRKEVYGTTIRYGMLLFCLSACPGPATRARGEWRREEGGSEERERWALKQDCPCFTWMSGSVIRGFPSVFVVVPYYCRVWWYRIMKHIHDTPQWISLVTNVQRPSRDWFTLKVHDWTFQIPPFENYSWRGSHFRIYDINNINSDHWIVYKDECSCIMWKTLGPFKNFKRTDSVPLMPIMVHGGGET